jgi:hypothetical protein
MKNPYLPSDPTEIEVHTDLLRFKHRSPKLAHFWGILLRDVEILRLGTDSGMNYSSTTLRLMPVLSLLCWEEDDTDI